MAPPAASRRLRPLCLALGALVVRAAQQAHYAPMDPARVEALLAQMTVAEKFLQTCIDSECSETRARWFRCNPFAGGGVSGGGDAWFVMKDLERLGVRGMRLRDGPKGMTCAGGGQAGFGAPCPEDGTSPAFPSQSLRAATWDTALEEEVGAAIGEIAALLDVHAALLPTINILPWLNWGRSQETYGEDPVFSGKMGAAVVRGVQREGKVMATAKHFLANNIENTRWWVSAEFDDKTLHEVYLKAWAIIVAESAPELVMTSYNRVQGKYPFADPKFIGLLRERLGFEGSVMTDWFASWEAITSGIALDMLGSSSYGQSSPYWGQVGFLGSGAILGAGVDMEMPFCSKNRDLVSQLQACALEGSEACAATDALDGAAARLLRSKLRYGLLGVSKQHTERVVWNDTKYDAVSLRVSQQGIVLLQNTKGFLPKAPSDVSLVAVVGTPDHLEQGDVGSSAVRPSGRVVTVLDGLRAKYGADKVVHVMSGSPSELEAVRRADMVVVDVGLNETFEGEFLGPDKGGDRKYLTLHAHDALLVQQMAFLNPNVVVAITSGQTVLVEDIIEQARAVLWLGYPGPLGGEALADILAGDVNPSGRMTTVTPKRAEDYLPAGINLQPWAADAVDAAPTYPYGHGFKHMWGAKIQPRYPMGWGLSYTTFSHSAPTLDVDSSALIITLHTEVTNTGQQAGMETVQVYGTCGTCKKARLPVVLLGFAKVRLEAGATKAVDVQVSAKDLAVYDVGTSKWVLEKGQYAILTGPSADPALLQGSSYVADADVVFDYPGKAAAPLFAPRRNCGSHACVKAAPADLIEALVLPSARWPHDPFLLLILGARLMGFRVLLVLLACAFCCPLCGCCGCCVWPLLCSCCVWLRRWRRKAVEPSKKAS